MLQEVFVEVHWFEVNSISCCSRSDSKGWILLVKLILHWFIPSYIASVTNEGWWCFTLFFFCYHFSGGPWTVLLPIKRIFWLFIIFFNWLFLLLLFWLFFRLLFWLFIGLCFLIFSKFLVPVSVIAVVSIFVGIFSSFAFKFFKPSESWKLFTLVSLTTFQTFLAICIFITVTNTKVAWICGSAERIADIIYLNWSWIKS